MERHGMLRRSSLAGLALVAALAAAFAPPAASQSVEPSASPTTLPDIGRVRASSTACSAVRDLIVPSVLAVRRGNARYLDVEKRLHRYVQIVDDEDFKQNSVYRQGALGQLDVDVIALKREALEINKALGDPRLSERSAESDRTIATLRSQLEQMYDAQATRVNLLQEYVIREHVAINKADLQQSDPFGSGSRGVAAALPTSSPLPGSTPPPFGMPEFHGLAMADTASIDDWAHGADAYARSPEREAARNFSAAADRCR